MSNDSIKTGRIARAPENFVAPALVEQINKNGLNAERRGFLRKSFLAASAAMASGTALAQSAAGAVFEGDPNILNLPEHARTLGQPVATNAYGVPSKYETNLLRRESHRFRSRHCRACSASSRLAACISSAITRAGSTSIRPSIAS